MWSILKWIGAGWALLGVGNLVLLFPKNHAGVNDFAEAVIINFIVFLFPGLVLFALGARFAKPKGLRKCSFCAEDVKVEALVCPHCRRDLAPAAFAG